MGWGGGPQHSPGSYPPPTPIGSDPPGSSELGDPTPRGLCPTEPPAGEQHPTEEGAENER